VENFRDEFIEANLFNSIAEAQEAVDVWVTDYNEFRPHEFLGDKTPMEFRSTIFNSEISSFGLST
jgi:putative transposase